MEVWLWLQVRAIAISEALTANDINVVKHFPNICYKKRINFPDICSKKWIKWNLNFSIIFFMETENLLVEFLTQAFN